MWYGLKRFQTVLAKGAEHRKTVRISERCFSQIYHNNNSLVCSALPLQGEEIALGKQRIAFGIWSLGFGLASEVYFEFTEVLKCFHELSIFQSGDFDKLM